MSHSSSCANLDSVDSNLLNKLVVLLPQKESEEFSLEGNHLLKPLTIWKLFSLHTGFALEHVCLLLSQSFICFVFFFFSSSDYAYPAATGVTAVYSNEG